MNITKTQWTIIGVIAAVILVWYFFLRKKAPVESGYTKISSGIVNRYSCPEGYSLYTNSVNGHSICVKLSTGEIKEATKS